MDIYVEERSLKKFTINDNDLLKMINDFWEREFPEFFDEKGKFASVYKIPNWVWSEFAVDNKTFETIKKKELDNKSTYHSCKNDKEAEHLFSYERFDEDFADKDWDIDDDDIFEPREEDDD